MIDLTRTQKPPRAWHRLTHDDANEFYSEVMGEYTSASTGEARVKAAKFLRELCQNDLFFLLVVACRRKDINRPWLYDRCREVELNPDGYLDLWSREHYKSTIITFGLTIQDILKDPEITVGIFSHTRPIAKAFLSQIKQEFEGNTFLKSLFPDVLYQNPERESPKWSENEGITVRRKTNPKERTCEAWGLVDGMPTSKHYSLLLFDDVVTKESVSSPEMIQKTTDSWALSLSLGAVGGRRRYIGTYYHANDTWHVVEERQAAVPRKYPASDDGTPEGKPVLWTKEILKEKCREMGIYVAGCQLFLNPVADKSQGFRDEWLRYYDGQLETHGLNLYLLCDPSKGKKNTHSDFTSMLVLGLGPDNNYYLVDAVYDRLNLTERMAKLFSFHRRYRIRAVGYEQYGMQCDIEHIQEKQAQANYRFPIHELGGSMKKEDRIRMLVPIFQEGRFYIPRRLMAKQSDGRVIDLIRRFVDDEYAVFPVTSHDDWLDCMARILHPEFPAVFPTMQTFQPGQTYQSAPSTNNRSNDTYDVLRLDCVTNRR